MKRLIIILFCIIHSLAIAWWSLSQGFSQISVVNAENSFETIVMKAVSLENYPILYSFFQNYIDFTGSQQYWDFFAPQSSKYHQYLSVCDSIESYPALGKIACKKQSGFSNLDANIEEGTNLYRSLGGYSSRLYRLTENLTKLEDPTMLNAFATYYSTKRQNKNNEMNSVFIVQHQFELHPELIDLPKPGYRLDKVIWTQSKR
ncbi:MAG: hypothetical protein IPN42_14190 [Methylococcaceae bacterium]|nr:hypothetical protein [Methylococcaceae bacterium]